MSKRNTKTVALATSETALQDNASLETANSEAAASVALLSETSANNPWLDKKRSVVPASYKVAYGDPQHNGDGFALTMAETTCTLEEIASQNEVDLGRWEGKNPGMVRMNLGNVLRGRIKRGEWVAVGTKIFNM